MIIKTETSEFRTYVNFKQGRNPTWKIEFLYNLINTTKYFQFELWHYNQFLRNNLIGIGYLDTESIMKYKKIGSNIPIYEGKTNVVAAVLTVFFE